MTRGILARVRIGLVVVILAAAVLPRMAAGGPFAAMVMDARTGEVLHAVNADTRLHPASLTKMMTLYIAFEAIKRGEISLDTRVRVSAKAANEQPSKLGLRAGQSIALRYLIRAAAVRSANDAATAIAEAIAGSEADFARRMNRTARALGMGNSTFRNAHGLTADGHLSTARDMTILGRRLIHDYPEYYNIFSRRSTDAGVATVVNTNSRFLEAYAGADGIKTGFTRAAGFNLVASAERGGKRIIATVFGGTSTAQRNDRVAELLDLGFRTAPARVAARALPAPAYGTAEAAPRTAAAPPAAAVAAGAAPAVADRPAAGRAIRLVAAPRTSVRPRPRPRPAAPAAAEPAEELLVAMRDEIASVIAAVQETGEAGHRPRPARRPAEAEAEAAPLAVAAAAAGTLPFQLVTEAAAAGAVPPPAAAEALAVAAADAAPAAGLPAAAEPPAPAAAAAPVAVAVATPETPRPAPRPTPPAAVAAAASLPEAALPAAAAEVPTAEPAPVIALAGSIATPASAPAADLPFRIIDDAPAAAVPATEIIVLSARAPAAGHPAPGAPEVVARASTSGGRHWGVTLGRFGSSGEAERVLLRVALAESATLDGALRRVVARGGGHEATFMGLTQAQADLACRRLQARGQACFTLGP